MMNKGTNTWVKDNQPIQIRGGTGFWASEGTDIRHYYPFIICASNTANHGRLNCKADSQEACIHFKKDSRPPFQQGGGHERLQLNFSGVTELPLYQVNLRDDQMNVRSKQT